MPRYGKILISDDFIQAMFKGGSEDVRIIFTGEFECNSLTKQMNGFWVWTGFSKHFEETGYKDTPFYEVTFETIANSEGRTVTLKGVEKVDEIVESAENHRKIQ